MSKVSVSYGKAEAGGWRAYVSIAKKDKHHIVRTTWFKTEKAAKNQATAWKRMYL